MKSKYIFEDKAEEIKEDNDKYEAHKESKELSTKRCDHKGKVKIENGMLRCQCGSAWSGPEIETLYKLFNA